MGLQGRNLPGQHSNTMNCHLSLLLLVGASQALPAADPQLGLPLFGGPVLYHAPNCTTEEDTITTKSCKPVTVNECEDVEFPGSKIEYVDNCRNAIVQQCGLKPVEETEEGDGVEAERKKREADPQFFYGTPYHHVVPLLKHVCEEATKQYCLPEAKIVRETNTVQRCLVETTVECEDVEHKIPKVVCAPPPLPAPLTVF